MTTIKHQWVRLIAWLLWLANSDPHMARTEFYALKDRILRRWGTAGGTQLQQITKECWRCNGRGWNDNGDGCVKCMGSGVFDRFWVILDVWTIAVRTFHRPREKTWTRPDTGTGVQILGCIEHAKHGRAASEALLWLMLMFDRGTFWRLVRGGQMACGWYAYPLMNVQRAAWYVRKPFRWVLRCPGCRWWTVRRPGWLYCRKCCRTTGVPF